MAKVDPSFDTNLGSSSILLFTRIKLVIYLLLPELSQRRVKLVVVFHCLDEVLVGAPGLPHVLCVNVVHRLAMAQKTNSLARPRVG